jgi:hypothetical protein
MGKSKKRKAMRQGADAEDEDQPDARPSCSSKGGVVAPVQVPVIPTLVSLAVANATYDGAHWWTVVSPVGNITVTATTQPNNNNGEWAQITWGGSGATQDPPNVRTVGIRAPQTALPVTALLNGPMQTVVIDIYDLTAIACNLRINLTANRWKDYAGFVANGAARMTATTDRNQAWPKLVWSAGGAAAPALNQQDYATAAVGDINVSVALAGKSIPAVLHICQWPVLAVYSITFSGGHTVNNDTVADFDNKWTAARAQANGANPQLDPSPLCYTCGNPITLTATLSVTTHPTDPENVTVRGRATIGGVNMVWTSGAIRVNVLAPTVSFPAVVGGGPALPNTVAAYNPVTITWEMSDPNGGWIGIGTTQHLIYATLRDPVGTPAYWTLLHYSCTGGAGAANDQQLITGAFNPLTGRNLVRKRDGVALCYWDPPAAPPQVPQSSDVWRTALLLAAPLGRGHCGSWAEFLMDMFKVHGVITGHKVNVTRAAVVQQIGPPVVVLAANVGRGFMVATWNFAGAAARSATDLTHTQGADCNPGAYSPGQNNVRPPAAFFNHWVVYCTTDNRIYDPSYGHDFPTPAAWEPPSISGLFSAGAAPNAGYSPVGGARLLQFHDTTTATNL